VEHKRNAPSGYSVLNYPVTTCNLGKDRPFGLGYNRGELLVGVVCTAEDGGAAADLRAIVYAYNPATTVWRGLLNVPLNYTKGATFDINNTAFVNVPNTCRSWLPWSDLWSDVQLPAVSPGGGNGAFRCRPMPMLSSIDVDNDGSLVMGFGDRFAHLTGYLHYQPDPAGANIAVQYGLSGGDILRAAPTATGYQLESAGTTALGGGCGANSEGPGGGEYYCGEFWDNQEPNPITRDHHETALGAVVVNPTTGQMAATVFDPIDKISQGVRWFDNATGTSSFRDALEIHPRLRDQNTFGKAAGLGDLEMMCDQAPIELGNRVWFDRNGDGLQGADEAGIGGVDVELLRGSIAVGQARTDAAGLYRFVAAATNDTDATDAVGQVVGGIVYGTGTVGGASEYTIRIRSVRGPAPQAPLVGRLVTFTTGDASTGSDGVSSGDDVIAVIPHDAIAHAGDNDHRFDFGFRPRIDWGDGPNQTAFADNGPRHIIVPGLFIGSGVQDDSTGTPTAQDNGDNAAGEEDGPTGPINLTPGRPTVVTIRVTNTTGATATLWGWIDLNGNGILEPEERASVDVPDGSVNALVALTFPATADAVPYTTTHARFRLSTDPASGAPTGLAQDGEVEDHLVSVLAAGALPKTGQPMLASLALATAFLISGAALLRSDRRRRTLAPIPVRLSNSRRR
jgi:GEVED domain/SdrD B-like domain